MEKESVREWEKHAAGLRAADVYDCTTVFFGHVFGIAAADIYKVISL